MPIPSTVVSPEIAAQVNPLAQLVTQQMVQFRVASAEDPILKHVTPETLALAIQAQSKKDERDHEFRMAEQTGDHDDKKASKRYVVVVVGIVLLFILILSWLFLYWNKGELVEKLVHLILAGIAGFAGGFGVGRASKKSGEK